MHDEIKKQPFIRKTFNTVASDYGLGASRFFHLSGEIMADLLYLKGNETVLDVASGTGATAIPVAKKMPQGKVTALDFSSAMLEQANLVASDLSIDNIIFHQGDMTNLPFDNNSFNHATCAFGLFFVDDMSGLLKHLADKIYPGGKILVSGFCGESFQPMAQLCLDRLRGFGIDVPKEMGWKRMSEPKQLNQIFCQAGLNDVTIETRSLGYFVDIDGWWEVVWNAGFRGLIEQLGDDIDDFKLAHFEELKPLCGDQGLWLTIDVSYTCGTKKSN